MFGATGRTFERGGVRSAQHREDVAYKTRIDGGSAQLLVENFFAERRKICDPFEEQKIDAHRRVRRKLKAHALMSSLANSFLSALGMLRLTRVPCAPYAEGGIALVDCRPFIWGFTLEACVHAVATCCPRLPLIHESDLQKRGMILVTLL